MNTHEVCDSKKLWPNQLNYLGLHNQFIQKKKENGKTGEKRTKVSHRCLLKCVKTHRIPWCPRVQNRALSTAGTAPFQTLKDDSRTAWLKPADKGLDSDWEWWLNGLEREREGEGEMRKRGEGYLPRSSLPLNTQGKSDPVKYGGRTQVDLLTFGYFTHTLLQ